MFGLPKIPWGLLGIADGTGTRPDNSQEDMTALQKLYAAAAAHNRTPNGRVARGFDQFGPQGSLAPQPSPVAPPALPPNPMFAGPTPGAPAFQQAAPVVAQETLPPAASAPAPVIMPTPRPAEAPQELPWWQRNAAMMQDPSSGAFLDPVNAQRAQASGPDLINKLLDMFHKKND